MLRNQNPIFDRLKVVALPVTGNYESSSKFQESVIQRKKNHLYSKDYTIDIIDIVGLTFNEK